MARAGDSGSEDESGNRSPASPSRSRSRGHSEGGEIPSGEEDEQLADFLAKHERANDKDVLSNNIKDDDIARLVATLVTEGGKTTMVRSYLAYKKQAKQLQGIVDLAYRELKLAQDAALAGKSLHTGMSMLVWDELQLLGQHDLAVREARESCYKDFLARQLTSALSSRSKDQSNSTSIVGSDREGRLAHCVDCCHCRRSHPAHLCCGFPAFRRREQDG